MESIPTREVMWNLGNPIHTYLMYASLGVACAVACLGFFRHLELVYSGTPAPEMKGHFVQRFLNLYSTAFLQSRVVRERAAAVFHSLIYLGFLVLLFTTTMVFLHHDLGIKIYQGDFYLAVTLMADIFGVALIIGCLLAGARRWLAPVDATHNRRADSGFLMILILLCVQGYLIEGLRILVTNDPWRAYSPVGSLVADLLWGMSSDSARVMHRWIWWFHTLTVMGGIAVIPYSKAFHIFASSANLFFMPLSRPAGALPFPGDLEKLMESGDEFAIGLGTIKDYSAKNLLDLEACTSCGRCQDACPAYNTGKPLSPKWVVLDTRNHALALSAEGSIPSKLPAAARAFEGGMLQQFLRSSGVIKTSDGYTYSDGGSFRAASPAVQQAFRKLGASADARIAGDVIDPMSFWSCTTCMACVSACPVGINHVDQIVGNRRNMALMHGEIPHEAQGTLRALENRANPYGDPKDRAKWLEGLDVPVLKAGDSVDYLYWVGCVSAYDPRKQKIARSLVTIMKRAGLSFGVLGNAEGCTGDPARRLGEENLFQSLAKKNIELLKSLRFKTLVANCPHCFNTIKNEYPQFGNLGDGREPEIIHHSKLLKSLLADGTIKLREGEERSVTFHDPCYLGRYNKEYEAPRETLRSVKGLRIIEMEESRERGMCCGAGGGHFWMDLKVGTRVNVVRTDQAAATGAETVATGCPFCMQMMEDGVKLTDRESSLDVRDIAEIVAEKLA